MKRSERDRWNAKGFRDALVHGVHDPFKGADDSALVEYEKGFKDGLRAIERIRQSENEPLQGDETVDIGPYA